MKIWTLDGHLSDEALELRAAGEADPGEAQAAENHLHGCPGCRAREAEWQALAHALATLRGQEPSPGFDAAVMARVRAPTQRDVATARLAVLRRQLRRVAVGAAAIWTLAVGGGVVWLQSQVELTPAVLLAGLLSRLSDLWVAGAIRVAALLRLSGLTDTYNAVADAVPGQGVALAIAAMTLLSGIAIWTLYRVTVYQPSGVRRNV